MIDLNHEYKETFRSLSTGRIMRSEAAVCMRSILNGDSVIIHGQAGVGKSGCTENIIQSCENLGILYLAIKLDKRIPKNTTEIWGKSMGLQASVSVSYTHLDVYKRQQHRCLFRILQHRC